MNNPVDIDRTAVDIKVVCEEIQNLLIQKNAAYGDSALNPVRIMSKSEPMEQLKVRIDDKLSRLASKPDAFGEDVVLDLLGYLILLRIAQKRANSKPALVHESDTASPGSVVTEPALRVPGASAQGSEYPGRLIKVDPSSSRADLAKALGAQRMGGDGGDGPLQ